MEIEAPPRLESFSAQIRKDNIITRRKIPSLPHNLFNRTAPQIKLLRLYACLIGSNTFLLPNLTSLALGEFEHFGGVSFTQLMKILKQTPKLECLELCRVCLEVNGVDDALALPENDSVQLPCLQHVDITGGRCNAILSQITHPTPLQHIALRPRYEILPERSIRALCATLTTRIPPVHHIRIRTTYWGSYDCSFLGQENLHLDRPPSAAPELGFHLKIERIDEQTIDWCMRIISETQSLAALQVLDVDAHVNFTKDLWLTVFGDLHNLTTIRVKHTTVLTLLQALDTTHFLNADASVKQPLRHCAGLNFKSLRVLIIQNWSFDSSIMDELTKCLTARRQCGAKLQ
ncbi:hypothetical protein H2248_010983 [Termitomyces sp. 'cryptogamus']|nr:hypothetical protein H2248_010983 [Termitomyces sp. 'cryptogamus']